MKKVSSDPIEAIFKQYHKELCRWAYTFVRDKDQAKDIVQDVFLKLWKNRDDVEWGAALKGYLYKATTNASLNYLESHKRKNTIHEQIKHNSSLISYETSDSIIFSELQTKVQQAIEDLPPRCKVIYLLSRQEGLKYQQIADQLELSIKTVENQMGIALEKLRTDLRPFLTKEFLLSLTLLVIGLLFLKFL